jgi:glycosyltransferase involved in cell wall biosynthesis
MPTSSLLISTYNWTNALNLCMTSLKGQSVLPNEIVICDDGSRKDTAELVDSFRKDFPIPINHVWQEDEGFQLAKIRNRGFAAAKGAYIIQVDGDLVFHKHFIKDHLAFAKNGFFTTGSRVLLSPQTTEALFKNASIDIKQYSINNRNLFNGLRIPSFHNFFSRKYKSKAKYKYYVKGCNMAFWKKDLLDVNGYNEDFTGWGREDSELAIRLINAGINKRFLKFGSISYHLFHKEVSREMEQKNIQMMKNAEINKITRTANGMDKYL